MKLINKILSLFGYKVIKPSEIKTDIELMNYLRNR